MCQVKQELSSKKGLRGLEFMFYSINKLKQKKERAGTLVPRESWRGQTRESRQADRVIHLPLEGQKKEVHEVILARCLAAGIYDICLLEEC